MFGINAYVIRMLCEDPFNTGGAGYTPEQVASMTPDQVWFRLCDKNMLKKGDVGRVRKLNSLQAAQIVDKEGMVKVRMADGTVVRMPYSTIPRRTK